MMVLAYPTPKPQLPTRHAIEPRQLDSFLSDVSSFLDGSTTTADSGGGSTGDGGSGGTTTTTSSSSSSSSSSTTPTTSDTTSQTSTTSSSSSSSSRTTTQAVSTSTDSSTNTGNGASVVTQVSTISGGQTIVVVKTTAQSTSTGTASNDSANSSSNGGLIGGVVGGVVGGLALLTALVLLFFLWRRRRSRTGHGYFLCFGTRPNRNDKDFDVNWPTFDPTLGSAAVGGTLGSRSGRHGNVGGQGGTLPEVDDGEGYDHNDEMLEIGSAGQGSYNNNSNNYYGAAPSAYSSGPHTGAHSASYKGPSEEGHYRNGWANGVAPNGNHAGSDDVVPTYDHLDPPEVRQARAREQAEAQAQAMASYGGGSPQMNQHQPAPSYYSASSPPPTLQANIPDHRLSTPQALASSQYFDDVEDPNAGTLPPQQHDPQRMLHLHNPDGA